MAQIYIAMFSGILIGFALALIIIPALTARNIKKKQFEANKNLYHQLLLKKYDRDFEYSRSIRKVINAVHVALLTDVRTRNDQPK